jgi:RNA recognition motif-containing protein
MAKKLFVGNISWNVSDDMLRDAFAEYGTVEDAYVLKDRETKRSRGFGFVTFTNDEEADAAIEAMNGTELDGRELTVNEAKPRD